MILFLMRTSGRFYFFDPINGNSLKSSNDGKSILLKFFNDFDFFDILNSDIKIYYSSNEEFIKGVVKKDNTIFITKNEEIKWSGAV